MKLPSRLSHNLNSQYLDAANRLKPKSAGRVVTAYVESYDDIWFWRSVLQEFESETLRFEVMLPSKNVLLRGKKSAMGNLVDKNNLGTSMIACVDADYDYLLQGMTLHSAALVNNPYVIHTQVYAIENYHCYAEGLREACVMATLNDHELMDVAAFIHEFSRIIWPLLVWSIWAYGNERFKEFSLADFARTVSLHDVNLAQPVKELDKLRHRVNGMQNSLYQRFPEGKKSYAALKDKLHQLGVNPDNCYLYMQGHTLFDEVVMPLLVPICSRLRRERENEIAALACHEKQRQNEMSCYQHSTSPIEAMLKKGTTYRNLSEYEKVRGQVRRMIERMTPLTPSGEIE